MSLFCLEGFHVYVLFSTSLTGLSANHIPYTQSIPGQLGKYYQFGMNEQG